MILAKKNIRLIIISLLLISCKSALQDEIKHTGTKKDARLNAIMDFSFNNRFVTHKVFIIDSYDESTELYCFKFNKNEKALLQLTDSIGGYPTASFPNKFIEKGNNLFLWNEEGIKITQELIEIMGKYNSIDSSYYKIPNYLPLINTGEFKKELFYFICKKNISKYEKRKAIWFDKEDYPKVECSG